MTTIDISQCVLETASTKSFYFCSVLFQKAPKSPSERGKEHISFTVLNKRKNSKLNPRELLLSSC